MKALQEIEKEKVNYFLNFTGNKSWKFSTFLVIADMFFTIAIMKVRYNLEIQHNYE